MAYAEDLESRQPISQHSAPKCSTAKIARVHRPIVSFYRARPRSETHLTESPTDTRTDTENEVKTQSIGNAARNAVSHSQGRSWRTIFSGWSSFLELAPEKESMGYHSCYYSEHLIGDTFQRAAYWTWRSRK